MTIALFPMFAVVAASVTAIPPEAPVMDPAQRDSQCLVAIRAEPNVGSMSDQAQKYFDHRVNQLGDAELVELLTILAEEVILENRNRREIALNCLLLYQVKLQEKEGPPREASGR